MAHFLNHSNLSCRFPGHHSATGTGVSAATTPPVPQASATPADPARQALVPTRETKKPEVAEGANAVAMRLPVELEISIPLRNFRVRNLLAMAPGVVVASQWGHSEDVPLAAGDVQLAWSEFEVFDARLAVRLTRLV
jgi:flagellar motor switch protein FliM